MLVEIFCKIDDFCKFLEKQKNTNLIGVQKRAGRKPELTLSEIMTIAIYYHTLPIKTFKFYYNTIIKGYERSAFKHHVSYNRFIELRQEAMIPLLLCIQTKGLGQRDGICHVLPVAPRVLVDNARESIRKTNYFGEE